MAIEILVTQNAWTFAPYAVDVYISNKIDATTRMIMHVDQDGSIYWTNYDITEQAVPADPAKPTYRIPVELLSELTRALMNHQGGIDDTRALRKDYDDERQRVDDLISKYHQLAMGE